MRTGAVVRWLFVGCLDCRPVCNVDGKSPVEGEIVCLPALRAGHAVMSTVTFLAGVGWEGSLPPPGQVQASGATRWVIC